jgi:hypothetical protein
MNVDAGAKVQVKYIDGGAPATIEACNRIGRTYQPEHWIYAQVLEVWPKKNAVRVKVNHRGNMLHGTEMIVAEGNFRTTDDVRELLSAAQERAGLRSANVEAKKQAKSLAVQLARLEEKSVDPKARQPKK